jgi:FkbM family methyltransferase
LFALLRYLRHGPASSALRPLWLLLGRLYRRLIKHVPFFTVARKIGPYGPFRLSPEFGVSDLDNWGNAHNKAFVLCVEACRAKRCVFDVGANVGFVTLPVTRVLAPDGKLFAFEPSATNARLLRRHLALNAVSSVSVIETLVGADDLDGVDFYESSLPDSQNSVVLQREYGQLLRARGYSHVVRRQLSLDTFCRHSGLAPEVVKIDVEGAEIDALRGARQLLMQKRPLVILSTHPEKIAFAGQRTDDLFSLLSDVGYEIKDTNGKHVQHLDLDEYIVAPQEMHWQP